MIEANGQILVRLQGIGHESSDFFFVCRRKDVRDVFAILEAEELGTFLVNRLGPKNNRMSTSEETASRRPLFRHNSSDDIVERESRDAPIQVLGVRS